ncbi:MAG: DUF697 domain-containing protein [Gammaproteobacteria bacterium]|nr:DUF697 domain-containing protein [Gammaproteobacteria bacterium]
MPSWWPRKNRKAATIAEPKPTGEVDLDLARESLQALVNDQRVPDQVRRTLAADYQSVAVMLEKIEQGHIHIAAFGRVSVGKSATLNALLGKDLFSTSPLHGETRESKMGEWQECDSDGVFLIDTPGINEVEGEARERLAHEVAGRSDLILFIVDGDITHSEREALDLLHQQNRPLLLLLNKADQYSPDDREKLLESLRDHTRGVINPEDVIAISARPPSQTVIMVDESGNETEQLRHPEPETRALKERLWKILEREGKTLAAFNATLFAGDLSQQIGEHILEVKRTLGVKVIRTYCISKGVAVALNPIPAVDLAAAAIIDITLVVHLSKLYGLPLSKREAGQLIKTIIAQMALLMGTVWAIHLLSSALKLGTGGLSALATGSAQGAVAYYSTRIVGEAAEQYLAQGKSWGEAGPKLVVREILSRLDRDSILAEAKQQIAQRIQ